MKELTGLVDDHTDYFKSHLEALPRTERKVYVALADLWDPSLARDVAKSARLEVSKTSSLLKRLVSRGAVTEIPGNGKKIRYRVTERMYNIYYLMRRRGAPSDRVRAAIDFMVKFYDETEILDITKKLGNEACSLACTERKLHYHAFEGIIKSVHPELQSKLLECAPEDFLKADDKPESLTNLLEELEAYKTDDSLTLINHILAKGVRAFMDGDLVRAEIEFQKAIDTAEKNNDAWICMAFLREETKQYDKAEDAYRNALELKPNDNLNWLWFGKLLREHTKDYIAAEKSFKKAIALNENNVLAWFHIAQLYQFNLKKYKQAEDAYIKVIKIDPEFSLAWAYMGILLHVNLSKISEAKKAYNNAIDSDKSNYIPRLGLIQIALRENTKDIDKPLKIADEAITDIPNNSDLLNLLAWTFINIYPRSLPSQILNWARKAVSIKKDETNILALACVLARNGHKEEALLCTKDLFNNDTLGEISAVNLATLFENLVLSGYAKETITILAESKHATRLEPILVALRMYSEEEVSVAPEIEKVARDILKMFQEADKRLLS
jgi:tetratricopeptide (TPR) repeat protein